MAENVLTLSIRPLTLTLESEMVKILRALEPNLDDSTLHKRTSVV